MKLKKWVALATAAAMCLSMTACSVSVSTNETTKAAESSAETTAAEAGDKEESGEAAESAAEGDLVATADYPTKPITMIIPYAAGGTTDVWGRKLAALLEKYLGQAITVTNQGGASGSIGSQFVKEQPSDGYTVLVCAETMGTYRTMNVCDLDYSDFTVISPLVGDPKVLVVGKDSLFFHLPKPGQSTAEHILSTYRPDQKFTHEEAKLLDMCLLVHADHGGGNCSTFTTRVLSSSGTDTYSAIAAAIGALKGPKHGGANLMVNRQLQDILKHVEHPDDDDEVREYLRRILRKQAGDGSGLIYGMGHAVYTMSDPREVILKNRARHLAYEKGFEEEYNMLCSIERLAPGIFAEEKGSTKPVCANVDLFSGLIYNMLGISEDIYTPLFAIARVPGWCAHRVEEVVFANRIIRPAYKYLGVRQKYKPIEER